MGGGQSNQIDSNANMGAMAPQNNINSGPQTQYSLDGMMGGGAPQTGNFLDQMSGIGMMGGQGGQELIVLTD